MRKNLVNLISTLSIACTMFSASSLLQQPMYVSGSSALVASYPYSMKSSLLGTQIIGENQPMHLVRAACEKEPKKGEGLKTDDFLKQDPTKINIKAIIANTKNSIRSLLRGQDYLELAKVLDKLDLLKVVDLYRGKHSKYIFSLNSDALFRKYFGVEFSLSELIKAFISDWSLQSGIPIGEEAKASLHEPKLVQYFERFVKLSLYRALNELAVLLLNKGPDFAYGGLKLREIFELIFSKDIDKIIESSRYDRFEAIFSPNIYHSVLRLNKKEMEREKEDQKKKVEKIYKIKEIKDTYLVSSELHDSLGNITSELLKLIQDPNLYSDRSKLNDYLITLSSIADLVKKISLPSSIKLTNFGSISRMLKVRQKEIERMIFSLDLAFMKKSLGLDLKAQRNLLEISKGFSMINEAISDILKYRANPDNVVLKEKDKELLSLLLIELFEQMSGIKVEGMDFLSI